MPGLLEGSIATKSSAERREILCRLLNDGFLPQRTQLLQFRDHTWQSAVLDDGYLAEMIAAIVVGVPGTSRRGVSRSVGDLRDGTEVKKGYRLDPNIDFVLTGQINHASRVIDLASIPAELALPPIRVQLNSNACSVQHLVQDRSTGQPRLIGGELGRTVGHNAMPVDPTGIHQLHLTRGAALPSIADGSTISVCLRQERGHINFSEKTRAQLSVILQGQPIMVFYHHDPRGRAQIVVVRVCLTDLELNQLLDEIYGDNPNRKCQTQPYLFADNIRHELSTSPRHSAGTALRARLLAVAAETRAGMEVTHWDPAGADTVLDHAGQLTAIADPVDCPEFRHKPIDVPVATEADRRQSAQWFFDKVMDGWYQGLRPYCALTGTTRNMGFGNLSQHLVSVLAGVRGTRSAARGADLVEFDGAYSEVKLATGEPGGDAMDTEDNPRLTFGWGLMKMLAWKRIFAVRVVDQGDGLQALVHAPTAQTMIDFRRQAEAYFIGRVNNGSGGLQYHALDPFPHDTYGPANRRLTFIRVGQFKSGVAPVFPASVPSW